MLFRSNKVDVLRVVVAQGMKPTIVGIALGLVVAFALGQLVTSMVYGVSSRDMATLVAVTALLLLVSFAASLSPALRATRISPLAVLRDE